MTYLILSVDVISTTNLAGSWTSGWAIVAPASTLLPVRTITSHMTSIATNTANDVGREVLLLRTVVLAVSYLSTVLTSLVFVVAEGTVQSSKFTKLVALELVLALRDRGSLYDSVSIWSDSVLQNCDLQSQ